MVPATDFSLAIVDNPGKKRFEVALTSMAGVPLCLGREAWPADEVLPPGFDGASLVLAKETKALLPTGSAYCPGGCGQVRVRPGETLRGAVPYAAFGDAATIAALPDRRLVFEVHPFACR